MIDMKPLRLSLTLNYLLWQIYLVMSTRWAKK